MSYSNFILVFALFPFIYSDTNKTIATTGISSSNLFSETNNITSTTNSEGSNILLNHIIDNEYANILPQNNKSSIKLVDYETQGKKENINGLDDSSLLNVTIEHKTENDLNKSNGIESIESVYDIRSPENQNSETLGIISVRNGINNTHLISKQFDKLINNEVYIKVRKCCDIGHYFNSISSECESGINRDVFRKFAEKMLVSTLNKIEIISQKLSCSGGLPPEVSFNVNNGTHSVTHSNTVIDLTSQLSYNISDYCFEFLGENENNNTLIMASCPVTPSYDYYDYYNDENEKSGNTTLMKDINLRVRKCCPLSDYYNTKTHKCTPNEPSLLNDIEVKFKNLSFESNVVNIEIISSRLTSCPDQLNRPVVNPVKNDNYRLRNNGEVVDITTGVSYDIFYYCMEQTGNIEDGLELKINLCPHSTYTLSKCCPFNEYFDENLVDCAPIPKSDKNVSPLLQHYNLDNNTYSLQSGYSMTCQNQLPSKEKAGHFNVKDGKLCLGGSCYGKEEYCIDYIGDIKLHKLPPMVYYCRRSYFVKCCEHDEILTGNGCISNSFGDSQLIKQLKRSRGIVKSFNQQTCKNGTKLLKDSQAKHIQWWLEADGEFLILEASNRHSEVDNYCIDDFINSKGEVMPGAQVCREVIDDLIRPPPPHHEGSIGKCCQLFSYKAEEYIFSSEFKDCREIGISNLSVSLVNHLSLLNNTEIFYKGFPTCSPTFPGYHTYPLTSHIEDYVNLSSDNNLQIISKGDKCVKMKKRILDKDFCFEHIMKEDGNLEPFAFVCTEATAETIYDERFALMIALLIISCVALFITLIHLFTMRVRRGLISVRKVNTLAGRILVSFVASHLLGFVALLITQFENSLNTIRSPGCYVLAILTLFFNLATFCWNTSICLESLLLTIHIKLSEWVRYALHSIWAWGFPGCMTLLMVLMDVYGDELPCGIIKPKIGNHYCFIFETSAKLLYFYLPILITLCANVLFLVGSRYLRNSRLRRLERGNPGLTKGKSKNGNHQPGHSGMRTHQMQNVTAESLRLVLWTGGTWFLELAGFVTSRYILPLDEERWYYYLWYIPTSFNALRGVGIFAIITITPDVRTRANTIYKRVRKSTIAKIHQLLPAEEPPDNDINSYSITDKSRSTSITSMLSNISYFRYYSNYRKDRRTSDQSNYDPAVTKQKRTAPGTPTLCQIEDKEASEEIEMEENLHNNATSNIGK